LPGRIASIIIVFLNHAYKAELPGHVPVMPSEKKKKDLLDKGGRFIKNSGEPL